MAIARKIVQAGVFEVTLTGGEILLLPFLQELIEYFNSEGRRPHVTSNGMLLDADAVSWMSQCQLTYQVSLDSARPEVHNEIRRSARAFELAVEGLKLLVQFEVPASIAYTATGLNSEDLDGVVALAEEIGVPRVCVGEVIPAFGDEQSIQTMTPSVRELAEFARAAANIRDDYVGRVEVAVAMMSGHLYDDRLPPSACTAGDRDLAILYDGWAYPCPFVRHPEARLGNVRTNTIEEIWLGEAALAFREAKRGSSTKPCLVPRAPAPVIIPLGRRGPSNLTRKS